MVGTIYSLIPALLTIALVGFTRRVVLSLGVGCLSAALILTNFNLIDTFEVLFSTLTSIFFEEGGLFGFLNSHYVSIIFFLIALGIITTYIVLSGGARAFTEAIIKRVKTREGVQYTAALLGVLIFIDDYFNALVVGNISKPLAQQKNVSRARLAYLVDSTSAPICVISPISSWATGIMGQMSGIFIAAGVSYSAFTGFLMTIPYHFYVVTCLVLVFITIRYNLNLGAMGKFEAHALASNDISVMSSEHAQTEDEVSSDKGTVWDLLVPILTLIIVTVGTMIYTGYQGAIADTTSEFNLFFTILNNIDLYSALRLGGFVAVVVAMLMAFKHVKIKAVTQTDYNHAFVKGARSMNGAILILILAWGICDLVGALDAGGFLANLISSTNLDPNFIPVVMFLVASFMAFATGTSWGAFGILLPIAGSVAAAIDVNLMIPVMAAVLSGAIFGDHASPISDTTLLSATGSGCDLGAHFTSQIPYALLAAGIAALGYLAFGFTGNLMISYIVLILGLMSVTLYAKRKKALQNKTIVE